MAKSFMLNNELARLMAGSSFNKFVNFKAVAVID